MGKLQYRLLIILNDSDPSSTDHHIALTLLLCFSALADLSIGSVAELCSVSKSALSKFVRRLGYDDYASFRADATFVENRFRKDYNYNTNIAQFLDGGQFRSYADVIGADLHATLANMDMDAIDELAHDLVSYRKVGAFGILYSEYAALDLQAKLAYNNKLIFTKMLDLKQQLFIDQSGPDSLLIIYSNSGDYLLEQQMSEFHERKDFSRVPAKVALVTSNAAAADYPGVDLCILLTHTTGIQTHANVYPFVNDLIVNRYRTLMGASDTGSLCDEDHW